MLNLTKHQEELLGEFKHPLLSHVFTVQTWKSNDQVSQCNVAQPVLTNDDMGVWVL